MICREVAIQPDFHENYASCFPVGGEGLELSHDSTGNTGGVAKSGAPVAQFVVSDPDLALIVDAWPNLAEAVKEKIVAVVNSHRLSS